MGLHSTIIVQIIFFSFRLSQITTVKKSVVYKFSVNTATLGSISLNLSSLGFVLSADFVSVSLLPSVGGVPFVFSPSVGSFFLVCAVTAVVSVVVDVVSAVFFQF